MDGQQSPSAGADASAYDALLSFSKLAVANELRKCIRLEFPFGHFGLGIHSRRAVIAAAAGARNIQVIGGGPFDTEGLAPGASVDKVMERNRWVRDLKKGRAPVSDFLIVTAIAPTSSWAIVNDIEQYGISVPFVWFMPDQIFIGSSTLEFATFFKSEQASKPIPPAIRFA